MKNKEKRNDLKRKSKGKIAEEISDLKRKKREERRIRWKEPRTLMMTSNDNG